MTKENSQRKLEKEMQKETPKSYNAMILSNHSIKRDIKNIHLMKHNYYGQSQTSIFQPVPSFFVQFLLLHRAILKKESEKKDNNAFNNL